jgi:hypothetical protein
MPDGILDHAKNNNAADIRKLVEAGVPVEFSNQVGSSIRLSSTPGALNQSVCGLVRWVRQQQQERGGRAGYSAAAS